jgi:hypothetical protein
MKTLTLEETVQWMERCISEGADWNEDFWSNYVDALHYLKEYRENKSGLEKTKEALEVKKKIYEDMTEKIMQQGQENEARCQAEIARYQEAVKNCERAENLYKQKQKAAEDALWKIASDPNEPLTWDELKTMEDKPVWIEYGTDEDTALKRWCLVQIVLDEYISLATTAIFFRAEKSKQGKTWQAYRKERE